MDTAHTFEFQFYKHENQVQAALHIIDNNFQTIKFGNIDVNKENQKQFEVITGYGWVTTDHFEKGVKLTLDSLKYRFECTSNRLMVSEESEVPKRIEDGRGNGCIRKVPGHRITTYTEDTCEIVWE